MTRIQPVIGAIQQRRLRILALVLIAVLAASAIYYFNLLTMNLSDVHAYKSTVSVLEQRRNDLSINLSKAVYDYSKHERSVLVAVVGLRSFLAEKGMKIPELEELMKEYKLSETPMPGKGPDKLAGILPSSALDRLLAIVEQHPDLKLATNFQNLMAALVEVEKDLAAARTKYNEMVNIYTTNMTKFPINLHAKLFGFKPVPYFEATEDARRFKPIDY
jgi:LemA protein